MSSGSVTCMFSWHIHLLYMCISYSISLPNQIQHLLSYHMHANAALDQTFAWSCQPMYPTCNENWRFSPSSLHASPSLRVDVCGWDYCTYSITYLQLNILSDPAYMHHSFYTNEYLANLLLMRDNHKGCSCHGHGHDDHDHGYGHDHALLLCHDCHLVDPHVLVFLDQ